MISVEEKLRVFSQHLLNKEQTWGNDTMNEVNKKQKELLENSAQKIKKEKRAIEERSYHTIFRDKNKVIAEGKNKAKSLGLEEKNRILIDFNQTVLAHAEKFLTKDVYENYLNECVEGIPQLFGDKKELIVFVNNKDLDQVKVVFNKKLEDYSVEYREELKNCIGGMTVEDSESRIYCDFTVENLLKTNYKLIGMTLNEFMEKQVG